MSAASMTGHSSTQDCRSMYGEVLVRWGSDTIGWFIDEELGYFPRGEAHAAASRIEATSLAASGRSLRLMGELEKTQYLVDRASGDRFAGYGDVYWRFDEMGSQDAHVIYGLKASPRSVWRITEQWIKVAMLQLGWSAAHSSAFVYEGIPVVVVGWQNLGKSRLLHRALSTGAAYVSEDFTWVSASGAIRGYPAAAVEIPKHGLDSDPSQDIWSRVAAWLAPARSVDAGMARRLSRRIARRLGYERDGELRVRMDSLYPDLEVKLEASAPCWLIVLPHSDETKPILTPMPASEAVERVVNSMMTDYYFGGHYQRYLYLCGIRAADDHLILRFDELNRALMQSALESPAHVWAVDSEVVLRTPDVVLRELTDAVRKGA